MPLKILTQKFKLVQFCPKPEKNNCPYYHGDCSSHLWMNGLYDSLTVIVLFPLIVFIGTCGTVKGNAQAVICNFPGDISYPLYIIRYPLIYMYTAWVNDHKPTAMQALPYALLCFISSIFIAYASLKWFDRPVREWLRRKMLYANP